MDSVQERNESESGDEEDLGKEEIDPVKEDREKQFKDNFDEIDKLLYGILKRHSDEQSNITKVRDLLKTIDEHVQDLLQTSSSDSVIASLHPESLSIPWKKLGEGNFGQVFESKLKGSRVAVKIFKEEAKSQIRESRLLRYLSHDNIIAYRGMGYITSAEQENTLVQGSQNVDSRTIDSGHSTASESSDLMVESMYPKMFFVMEFIEHNLFQYIAGLETHERQGLSASKAWDVGVQIVGALSYLHSLKIAHRDLKPDNILIQVGPNRFVIKIADFGLSWRGDQINNQIRYQSGTSSGISGFSVNIRWGPPEFKEESSSSEKPKLPTLEDQKRGDIYCLGLVLAFAISGVKPFAEWSSVSLDDHELDDVCLPVPVESLPEGCLGKAIQDCTNIIPGERPSIDDVVDKYFTGLNPYVVYAAEGELFSCGFMTKTDIFVADSCINRDATQEGYFKSKERPVGYDHNDLKCRIEVGSTPCRDRYESWDKEDKYFELYQRFKQDAYNKIIDNNPTVALKQLLFARPGEEECQTVVMNFKQSEYVHHKAMRSIWMSLSEQERKNALPNKAEVNPFYSNTFGLHVAVLTDEGPGNPPQFVFPQRSNRVGMSSPGAFTCGAVESASTPDYIEDRTKVDFVNTAARGLREEIGLDLTGSDLDAICLTTIYLKVDTHEWGLCGFVDLSDERIKDENRISAESIKDRFSSGPKDKFEHQRLHFVPFELESMVNFVFEKHEYFASSAKLVVVKVLQAYFGWSAVQNEFESRLLDN